MGQWVWYPNLNQWVWVETRPMMPPSPFQKKRSLWWLWTLIGIAGIVGAAAVGVAAANTAKNKAADSPVAPTTTLAWPDDDFLAKFDGSGPLPSLPPTTRSFFPIKACEQFWNENELKAPATAKYSQMSITRTIVANHKWDVAGVVDAENSFGALLRQPVYCTIWTYDGVNFRTSILG